MDIAAWQTQLRKGAAELAVLSVLGRGERYGLQLLHAVNAAGALVTEGGLYPLLSRLEKSGRIAARWDVPTTGNPRKFYTLTDEGRRLAAEMRAGWIAFRTTIATIVEQEDEHGA